MDSLHFVGPQMVFKFPTQAVHGH